MAIEKVVKKFKLGEEPRDFSYWKTRSCQERIDALEEIRREYNEWRYDVQQGFQRVYKIIKLK
jgi:hypothetical protein